MEKLAKYNCYVGLLNGKLHLARLVDGWPKFIAGQIEWIEADTSVSQDFLDAANASLKTSFRIADFPRPAENKPSSVIRSEKQRGRSELHQGL